MDKKNQRKIIISLCGGTGAWEDPYRQHPDIYDVRLITLPEFDVRDYEPPDGVYGILAAPPCTEFSIARSTAKTPRDLQGAMEIVSACLRIIWECQYDDHRLKFWAIENPTGILRRFLGRPRYQYRHNNFGERVYKPTDIWGFFNEPQVSSIPLFVPQYSDGSAKKYACPKQACRKLTRAARRAITPAGFARAFFKANQ